MMIIMNPSRIAEPVMKLYPDRSFKQLNFECFEVVSFGNLRNTKVHVCYRKNSTSRQETL